MRKSMVSCRCSLKPIHWQRFCTWDQMARPSRRARPEIEFHPAGPRSHSFPRRRETDPPEIWSGPILGLVSSKTARRSLLMWREAGKCAARREARYHISYHHMFPSSLTHSAPETSIVSYCLTWMVTIVASLLDFFWEFIEFSDPMALSWGMGWWRRPHLRSTSFTPGWSQGQEPRLAATRQNKAQRTDFN